MITKKRLQATNLGRCVYGRTSADKMQISNHGRGYCIAKQGNNPGVSGTKHMITEKRCQVNDFN